MQCLVSCVCSQSHCFPGDADSTDMNVVNANNNCLQPVNAHGVAFLLSQQGMSMVSTGWSAHGNGLMALKIATFCGLVLPGLAKAALVENLTIANPKALALGHAVTADPPGVDSIHYNPAGLARITGQQRLLKLTAAYFNFRVDFGDYIPIAREQADLWGQGQTDPVLNSVSETDNIAVKVPFTSGRQAWPLPAILVPTGGAAFQPADMNYTLGTAAFAPMAAGYIRDEDDPGSLMGKEMALTRLTYFAPTVGFQLTDEWSLGVGVHLSYQGISAYTDLRVNHIGLGIVNEFLATLHEDADCLGGLFAFCDQSISPFEQSVTLEVDVETPLSLTAVFGALWEPLPWFTWGFVYHTETTNRMRGTYRMSYSEDWQGMFKALSNDLSSVTKLLGLPTGLAEQSGDARIDLKTPAHFATGISVQLFPDLKVNLDAKWTDWKTWHGLKIEFDKKQEFGAVAALLAPEYATSDTLIIPRHYASVWNYAIGMEYQYNRLLALRFGWEPRKSSVPDDKQDVLLPLGDANLITCGLGFQWKQRLQVDLAFGYFKAKADVPAGSSTNANSIDVHNNILYNPYSGIHLKSESTAFLVESAFTWQW